MKFSEWVKPDTIAVLCTAVYVGVPSQGHEKCYIFINECASAEQVTRDEPDIEIKRCIECGKPLIQKREYIDETGVRLIVNQNNPGFPGHPKLTVICPDQPILSLEEINEAMSRLQDKAGISPQHRMPPLQLATEA